MNNHLLSDAAIRQFIVDGYVQVQTELPDSVHRAIFEKTDAIFSKIRSPDVEWAYNPLNNVLPVVPELQQVMDAPQVRGALTSLLGPGYVMLPHRHCHPNFAKPEVSVDDGRKLIMGIHKDGHAGGQKPRHRVPRWAILFYYPQECPDEQGPTAIVPRSHYQHNLARQGDADPNLTLAARGDGSYGLPEHYIHRTMLPLACGLGAVSIMHFDVGHSVIENLAAQHRYGQKFVFMRTEEPDGATWDNRVASWEQPDVTAIPDHEILWTYIWNWMRGADDRFLRGAGARLQRRSAAELIRLLESPEPARRLQAANELGFLRAEAADTEGTVAALVRALRDEYEPVRLNAAYALGAIGEPAQAPLLELLATDAAFYEFDPVTHVSIAAHALGAMGGTAVEALAERLTAGGEHTRSWAAYALGEIGRPAAGAPPPRAGRGGPPPPVRCRNCSRRRATRLPTCAGTHSRRPGSLRRRLTGWSMRCWNGWRASRTANCASTCCRRCFESVRPAAPVFRRWRTHWPTTTPTSPLTPPSNCSAPPLRRRSRRWCPTCAASAGSRTSRSPSNASSSGANVRGRSVSRSAGKPPNWR